MFFPRSSEVSGKKKKPNDKEGLELSTQQGLMNTESHDEGNTQPTCRHTLSTEPHTAESTCYISRCTGIERKKRKYKKPQI